MIDVNLFFEDEKIYMYYSRCCYKNVRYDKELNKFIEEYVAKNQSSPSMELLSKEFEISESEIVYVLDSSIKPMSLFTLVGDESGKEQYLIDKIEDDKPIDKEMDNELLYKIIKDLPQREKKIIILRYFRDKTQKDIAIELGVSQVQVSRLENKILQKLKDKLT